MLLIADESSESKVPKITSTGIFIFKLSRISLSVCLLIYTYQDILRVVKPTV